MIIKSIQKKLFNFLVENKVIQMKKENNPDGTSVRVVSKDETGK